jgi:hypothetical protein
MTYVARRWTNGCFPSIGPFMQLRQNFFFHHHSTVVVKLAFVPEGTVRKVIFSRGRTHSQLLRSGFVMCSSLIPAGFRGFSLRIRHSLKQFILISLICPSGGRSHRRRRCHHRFWSLTCRQACLPHFLPPRPMFRFETSGEAFSSAPPGR